MIREVIMDAIFEGEMPRARLAVLLKHFSQIDDDREPWRVVYPARLILGQLSVPEKANEITAIPDSSITWPKPISLKGALVTIDAIGCQVAIADKIIEHQADCLLALKA
jgi:hypothetical protein